MTRPTGRPVRPGARFAAAGTCGASPLANLVVGILATMTIAWVVAIDWFCAAASRHVLGWLLALGPISILALFALTVRQSTAPRHRAGRHVLWLVPWGAMLLAVLVILVPWNQRKQFVHDVFSVQAGMSVDAVDDLMAGYIHGAGAKWQLPPGPDPRVGEPDEPPAVLGTERATSEADDRPAGSADADREHFTGTRIYRWCTGGKHDSDWGLVQFAAGKVVRVDFLPD